MTRATAKADGAGRLGLFLVIVLILLVIAVAFAAAIGDYRIGVGTVFLAVTNGLGLDRKSVV